jgi:hypothetical protein
MQQVKKRFCLSCNYITIGNAELQPVFHSSQWDLYRNVADEPCNIWLVRCPYCRLDVGNRRYILFIYSLISPDGSVYSFRLKNHILMYEW